MNLVISHYESPLGGILNLFALEVSVAGLRGVFFRHSLRTNAGTARLSL